MKTLKRLVLLCLLLLKTQNIFSQDPVMSETRMEQLESQSEKNDAEPEDDAYDLELETFRKHPLNLNTVTEEELIALHLLTEMQVRDFISYRNLLGPLLSIHELQALPGWDLPTIRKLLLYIYVGGDESVYTAFRERWKAGESSLLLRAGQTLEKSKGYEKPANPNASYYLGSTQKLFIRYNYSYKQLLSFGFTADKDAGEPLFGKASPLGFDFYSFHLFMQRIGIIRSLAIGDFTVNLGQGLIQWQTFSFTKTSQTMAIKREAPILKPYHSAGEFNFHRGVAITLEKAHWQGSLFFSNQKISTNAVADTTGREDLFSSFENSGYHRTPNEIADRNNSRQISAGLNIRYTSNRWMIGLNAIRFYFSRAFQKQALPYNLFSLQGKTLGNYSFEYSYTFRNVHLFGEGATDHHLNLALLQGMLVSLGEKLDMSFVYRNISTRYQSLYADAFTENSTPVNEEGLYVGLSFKPLSSVLCNIYYDVFVFPWLRYRVDGPSRGREVMIQSVYQPDKIFALTLLYKMEEKTANGNVQTSGTHALVVPVRQRARISMDYVLSRKMHLDYRMENVWYRNAGVLSQGFLASVGLAFNEKWLSGNVSCTRFDTDNYDARIYSYQPDVLYNYSLPAFYGKGIHYNMNVHKELSRLIRGNKGPRIMAWLKWSQTRYSDVSTIGSGLDLITGNHKTEFKVQLSISW